MQNKNDVECLVDLQTVKAMQTLCNQSYEKVDCHCVNNFGDVFTIQNLTVSQFFDNGLIVCLPEHQGTIKPLAYLNFDYKKENGVTVLDVVGKSQDKKPALIYSTAKRKEIIQAAVQTGQQLQQQETINQKDADIVSQVESLKSHLGMPIQAKGRTGFLIAANNDEIYLKDKFTAFRFPVKQNDLNYIAEQTPKTTASNYYEAPSQSLIQPSLNDTSCESEFSE